MVDERTTDFPEPPIDHDDVENGTNKNQIYNRSIAHATIPKVDNSRFITICTLKTRQEKKTQKSIRQLITSESSMLSRQLMTLLASSPPEKIVQRTSKTFHQAQRMIPCSHTSEHKL